MFNRGKKSKVCIVFTIMLFLAIFIHPIATLAYPGTSDTDGDGIDDNIDLDDDNDGIADAIECSIGFTNITAADLGIANNSSDASVTDVDISASVFGLPAGSVLVSVTDVDVNASGVLFMPPSGGTHRFTVSGTVATYIQAEHFSTIPRNNRYKGIFSLDGVSYTLTSSLLANFTHSFIAPGQYRVRRSGAPASNGTSFMWVSDMPATSIRYMKNYNIGNSGYAFHLKPLNDTDSDGVADCLDLDSDNDGIADIYEGGNNTVMTYDVDGDGHIDPVGEGFVDDGALANSSAGNGLDDRIENFVGVAGSGITPVDSFNTASDDVPDYLDLDSDDDGIPDATEGRATADYVAYPSTIDTTSDSDDDGILDMYDNDGTATPSATTFGSTYGVFKTGLRIPNDNDSDGTPDHLDLDSDDDGISDSDPDESGTITGLSYADPDGNVNDPLSGILDNDDLDATGADVDFRSVDIAVLVTNSDSEQRSSEGISCAEGKIGNRLWYDFDGDGKMDENESGIEGISIKLKDKNGKTIDKDKTNSNGKYNFDDLEEGEYKVVVDQDDIENYTQTYDPNGSVMNNVARINLGCNEDESGIDFGFKEKSDIENDRPKILAKTGGESIMQKIIKFFY